MDGAEAVSPAQPSQPLPVRVVVRIRPVTRSSHTAVSFVDRTVAVTSDIGTEQVEVDGVLVGTEESQEQFFGVLGQPMIQGILQGISQSLIAYGPTGSGKTFAVLGTKKDPGLLPRLGQSLQAAGSSTKHDEPRVWFSALELFDDQVQDLLAPGLSERRQAPVFVQHPIIGTQVVGATEVPCLEAEDLPELIDFTLKRRALTRTCLHASSSRASQVYSLRVEARSESGRTTGKIYLFDLAAPEKPLRAPCPGLSSLHTLVRELCGEDHRFRDVLFRASPLTLALKDSLVGSWRTTFAAMLLAGSEDASESAATLRFAAAMRQMRTWPAASKMRSEQLLLLQEEVVQMKAQAMGSLDTQLKSALADRSRLIADLMTQPASQTEERRKLARERAKALEWCGLQPGPSESLLQNDETTPHLLNLSDDPMLAGCLLYFLPKGERTAIGSDPDNSIVIDGLGMLPNLCSIINQDDATVVIARADFARRHVLLNGKMLNTSEGTALSHNDRVSLGRAQLFLVRIPQADAQEKPSPTASQKQWEELQERCRLPADLLDILPALPEGIHEDADFEKLTALLEHSDSLKDLHYYVKDLLPKLPASDALACFEALRKACYLLDEANLITREVRPEDHMRFEVELIWDIFRKPDEILLIRLFCYAGNGVKSTPRAGISQSCQVLHYWSYSRFMEKLDQMRDVHRLHCQGIRGWTGRANPLHDPWLEPSTSTLRQFLLTSSLSECRLTAPASSGGTKGSEPGPGKQQNSAQGGGAGSEVERLKVQVAELLQELEDKNEDLEEMSQLVRETREQNAQALEAIAAVTGATGAVASPGTPEGKDQRGKVSHLLPPRKESHDTHSQPSEAEHSCTMTVSASTSEGEGTGGERRDGTGAERREGDRDRSRGFRVDNFGTSKANHSGAPIMLSQSSLTPPHYYRDLRR